MDSKQLRIFENDDMEGWRNKSSLAREEIAAAECEGYEEYDYQDERTTLKRGDWRQLSREKSKKKYVQSQMLSYKQQGSYDIPEDVYAFITVAPVCSAPFMFACTVILIKYLVYGTLLWDIKRQGLYQLQLQDDNLNQDDTTADRVATAVKFFLIPVTVAMQEDLMAVYAGLANARYDPKVLEISEAATKAKFVLAYLLQLIDGMLSLSVNFLKMFTERDILDVFLNFAALHFLQDIDDVFYALVEKGFFGDDMEHMSTVCKQISWPRRSGTTKCSQFLSNLDSLLFGITFLVCLVFYFLITLKPEVL